MKHLYSEQNTLFIQILFAQSSIIDITNIHCKLMQISSYSFTIKWKSLWLCKVSIFIRLYDNEIETLVYNMLKSRDKTKKIKVRIITFVQCHVFISSKCIQHHQRHRPIELQTTAVWISLVREFASPSNFHSYNNISAVWSWLSNSLFFSLIDNQVSNHLNQWFFFKFKRVIVSVQWTQEIFFYLNCLNDF